MIAKGILKEVVVKTDLVFIAIQILKHVYVENFVQLMVNVKKDIVACIV